jgi:hypothetical protein
MNLPMIPSSGKRQQIEKASYISMFLPILSISGLGISSDGDEIRRLAME